VKVLSCPKSPDRFFSKVPRLEPLVRLVRLIERVYIIGGLILAGKAEVLEHKPAPVSFLYYKTHMDRPGTEPGPSRLDADVWPPQDSN
jgi:hypothetical protein